MIKRKENINQVKLGKKELLSLSLSFVLSLSACSLTKRAVEPSFQRDLGKQNSASSKMLPINPEQAVADKANERQSAKIEGDKTQASTANEQEQATIRQAIGRDSENSFDRDKHLKTKTDIQNVPVMTQKVLRLPIIKASEYHPYIERNEYDQVLSRLLFRSLFRLDKFRRLTKDLVQEYRYSYEQKLIEISLDEKALYADNTPIDAYDVVQAINLLKDNNLDGFAGKLVASSAYFHNLSAIERVEQVGAYGLRIYLNKPDLNIAYALTFPILKNSELYNKGLSEFTSSGAYRQVSAKEIIAANDSEQDQAGLAKFTYFYKQRSLGERPSYFNSLLHRFAVKNYEQEAEAVQAFLNKEIDLCYTWPAYTEQLAHYEHYVFSSLATLNLTFNWPDKLNAASNTETNKNSTLNDYYSDVQLMKTKLSAIYNDTSLFRSEDPALSPAAYSFVEDLFRPYKMIPAYPINQLIRERKKLASDFKQKKWRLLVPNNLSFAEDIIAGLQQQFTAMGVQIEIINVDFANFRDYIKNNAWDMLIYPLLAHRVPDLGYELKELSNGNFWRQTRGQEFLPEFYVYPEDAQKLIDYMNTFKLKKEAETPLDDVDYQQKFSQLYQYSNNMPLLKYNRALYLQDSLRGELRPYALDPLAGVEDLWIWSTP